MPERDADTDSRKAGLRGYEAPSLEQVERRRTELLAIISFAFIAFSVGMVLLSFAPESLVDDLGVVIHIVRLGLIGVAIAFVAYVIEKERNLRHITKSLMNERVVSSALMNQLRDVSLLAEAGRAVTSGLGLRDTLGRILETAGEQLEADEGSIQLLADGELILAAGLGRSSAYVDRRQPIGDGLAGYVARTGQPVVVNGDLELTELAQLIDRPQRREHAVLSSLCVPLRVQDEIVGVMNLGVGEGDRRYEEHDRHTLELFAHHAALAMYQARLLGAASGDTRSGFAALDRMRAEMVGRIAGDLRTLDHEPSRSDGTPVRPRNPKADELKLLYVDDDASLLRNLQVALSAEGYEVLLASDGQTALTRIQKERPDVVLLDISIPVMDGWRVLEQLKDRADRPRIIVVTASTTRRERMRAWMLGIDEYVTKPFEVSDLVGAVHDVATRSPEAQADRRDEALRDLFAAG